MRHNSRPFFRKLFSFSHKQPTTTGASFTHIIRHIYTQREHLRERVRRVAYTIPCFFFFFIFTHVPRVCLAIYESLLMPGNFSRTCRTTQAIGKSKAAATNEMLYAQLIIISTIFIILLHSYFFSTPVYCSHLYGDFT